MKSLTMDESPLQLLVDFSDFLSKYNSYLGTTWWPKLKRAFARHVTYPLLSQIATGMLSTCGPVI